MKPERRVYCAASKLADAAAELFAELARDSVAAHGRFAVALSGGSTPRETYRRIGYGQLVGPETWRRTHLFWGDERCVPPDHRDSNYRMAREAMLSRVPVPQENIHRIQGELPPEEAADRYDALLRDFFANAGAEGADEKQKAAAAYAAQTGAAQQPSAAPPRFDLLFLGMGEDGHTASLFPGSPLVREESRWAAATYAEHLAAWRVSLTPPVLNAAATIVFLVCGTAKAARVKDVLESPSDPDRLPAQIVAPSEGRLIWLVDAEAATLLE